MSDVATLIADLVRAGVDPELIGRTAEALAQREPVRVIDEQAERRRAADRERKARLRNSAESAEQNTPDKEKSPTPPKEINPKKLPPSPPKGGSSPTGFDTFWEAYPHKVGKADARKKFDKAVRIAPFETIMAGLQRYVAKTDDRPWCNPATWLHQERWGDEPAEVQPRASPQPDQPQRRLNLADAFGAVRQAKEASYGYEDRETVSGSVLYLPAQRGE